MANENGRGLALVAIGGNSLISGDGGSSAAAQYAAAARTVAEICELIERGWRIVVTHGSGPQVGLILRASELAAAEVAPTPLDYADADVQGALGYMFQRALDNEFRRRSLPGRAVALVTQVRVDAADPAFARSTKPVGPVFDEKGARAHADALGWTVGPVPGRGWQRLVPSPRPLEIVEIAAIRTLVEAGQVVIACGGGGIPVVEAEGGLAGVEAVIDKDLASGLLARALEAELFLVSTRVEKVAADFGRPGQRWLDRLTAAEARALAAAGQFDAGTMGPKIEAMIEFVEAGKGRGAITDPAHLRDAAEGAAGTQFTAV